jgi:predicted regulator of Ras-like GTPase activity (Roadblock/LC7/MglB family)
MPWTREKASGAEAGFRASLDGMGLTDLIQLQETHRFSGCVEVDAGGEVGRIFFRDGQIVHAETAHASGEDAFVAMMAWAGGHLTPHPSVSTTQLTIRKTTRHLLMDALRILDERRAGLATPPDPERRPAAGTAALFDQLRAVPGISYAVVTNRTGRCVDDASHQGETLGGQGHFIASVAERLGGFFKLGAVTSAVGRGKTGHVIVMAGTQQLLTLLTARDSDSGAVAESVRKILRNLR